jgi:hypothetical protein
LWPKNLKNNLNQISYSGKIAPVSSRDVHTTVYDKRSARIIQPKVNFDPEYSELNYSNNWSEGVCGKKSLIFFYLN